MKKIMMLLLCVAMPLLAIMTSCNNGGYEPTGPMAYGHEYVELGLSVKWATCNVGANKPEAYGDYFAWGETETKATYSKANYKWWDAEEKTYTKYFKSLYGAPVLEKEDDVASVKWGGEWRMPTIQEFRELMDNCEHYYEEYNGINGWRFVSKINGKSIFLPAAGDYDPKLGSVNKFGSYATSTLSFRTDSFMQILFDASSLYYIMDLTAYRSDGVSVRPVMP